MLTRHVAATAMVMLCALLCGGPALAQRFPVGDGFTYPGQPGSEEITAYYQRLNASPRHPRPPGRLPAYDQVAWLAGRWNVTLRDYAYAPPEPGHIIEVGTGTADITFTPDEWWLRNELHLAGRNRLWFLGYDDVAEKWLLREIGRPGGAYAAPLLASAWKGDRMTFEPTELVTFSGIKLVDRLTIVRDDRDHFRIVVEGQMPSGRFVAVHDFSFTRST